MSEEFSFKFGTDAAIPVQLDSGTSLLAFGQTGNGISGIVFDIESGMWTVTMTDGTSYVTDSVTASMEAFVQAAEDAADNASGSADDAEASNVEAEGHADRAALEAADALSAVSYQDMTAINNTYNQSGVVALFSYNAFNDEDFGAWRLKWPHLSYKREARPTGPWLGYLANEAAARAADGAGTGSYYHNSTDGKFYQLSDGSGQVEIFRGAGRDMPSQVDIVCEIGRVVLWDRLTGEMWMVFPAATNRPVYADGVSSVKMSNGKLYIGSNGASGGYVTVDFSTEKFTVLTGFHYDVAQNISQRNNSVSLLIDATKPSIVNRAVNAIAVTTLPNAPINTVTGLPYDRVTVATAGGLSVILEDGTVHDSGSPLGVGAVACTDKGIWWSRNTATNYLYFATWDDVQNGDGFGDAIASSALGASPIDLRTNGYSIAASTNLLVLGGDTATGTAKPGLHLIYADYGDFSKSLDAVITDTYATGVMPAGIKFAGLCDTDATDLVAANVIEDRSHNGVDLTLSSTASVTKVATGADLVWFEFAADEVVTLGTDVSSTGMVEWWEEVSGVATYYAKDLSGGTSYVNGFAGTPPANSITFSGAVMTLKSGKKMALARPSSTTKSADQVAAAYAIERHWFEPDAVVTLDNAVVRQVVKSGSEIHVLTDGGHNIFDADTYVRTSFEAGDFNHISVTDGVVLKD